MSTHILSRSSILLSLAGAALFAQPVFASTSEAERLTRHVANNGVDDADCGARRDPCRTISQAIALSASNDRIIVGPGRYGDLDSNGVLSGPGEERGGPSCNCVVWIDRPVTIRSAEGATSTVIDAVNILGDSNLFAVRVVANDVTLGRAGRGFTIKGSRLAGGVSLGAVRNVVIAGNIFNDNASGVQIPSGGRDNIVVNNLAVGSGGSAFDINGTGNFVLRNTAIGNGDGFTVSGERNRIASNVATSNSSGYTLIGGSAHEIVGNSAIGNTVAGIQIFPDASGSIHRNNIFGNGDQPHGVLSQALNCGIVNASGLETRATNNFWGAMSGPGANPADEECDVTGTLTVEPFATTPFNVPDQWTLF